MTDECADDSDDERESLTARLRFIIQNLMQPKIFAFGTAALATIVTKREQFHSNIIGNSVSLLDPATRDRLDHLTNYFLSHGVSDAGAARHKAIVAIGRGVARQSFVMGYSDTFVVLGVLMAAEGDRTVADVSVAGEFDTVLGRIDRDLYMLVIIVIKGVGGALQA